MPALTCVGPSQALLLPDDAVLAHPAARIVQVLDAEGIVQPRLVEIGRLEQGLRVIRKELGPQDRVVVGGLFAGAARCALPTTGHEPLCRPVAEAGR